MKLLTTLLFLFTTLTTSLSLPRSSATTNIYLCPAFCTTDYTACKLGPVPCADKVCGPSKPENSPLQAQTPCALCDFCRGRVEIGGEEGVEARGGEPEQGRCEEGCKSVAPLKCRLFKECSGCHWCPFVGEA